jgi:UrcA family protein
MNARSTSTDRHGLITMAIFGVLALSSTAASAAAAAEINPVGSLAVNFKDLDLSTQKGADALYRRIRRAAADVCWLDTGADDAAKTVVYLCIRRAMTSAVIKINKPALFAVYNAKNKPPLPITLTAEQGH